MKKTVFIFGIQLMIALPAFANQYRCTSSRVTFDFSKELSGAPSKGLLTWPNHEKPISLNCKVRESDPELTRDNAELTSFTSCMDDKQEFGVEVSVISEKIGPASTNQWIKASASQGYGMAITMGCSEQAK